MKGPLGFVEGVLTLADLASRCMRRARGLLVGDRLRVE